MNVPLSNKDLIFWTPDELSFPFKNLRVRANEEFLLTKSQGSLV